MMDDIYEVTQDEYAGFIGCIKRDTCDMETAHLEDVTKLSLVSKKTGKTLATRLVYESGEEKYYVYNMPDDDERCAPKPVQKIVLEDKEEVQKFFEILQKIQKGEINDGTIS